MGMKPAGWRPGDESSLIEVWYNATACMCRCLLKHVSRRYATSLNTVTLQQWSTVQNKYPQQKLLFVQKLQFQL